MKDLGVLFSWNKTIVSSGSCWDLIHYTVWNFWWKLYFVFLLYKYHMSITLKQVVLYVVSIASNTKVSCSFVTAPFTVEPSQKQNSL